MYALVTGRTYLQRSKEGYRHPLFRSESKTPTVLEEEEESDEEYENDAFGEDGNDEDESDADSNSGDDDDDDDDDGDGDGFVDGGDEDNIVEENASNDAVGDEEEYNVEPIIDPSHVQIPDEIMRFPQTGYNEDVSHSFLHADAQNSLASESPESDERDVTTLSPKLSSLPIQSPILEEERLNPDEEPRADPANNPPDSTRITMIQTMNELYDIFTLVRESAMTTPAVDQSTEQLRQSHRDANALVEEWNAYIDLMKEHARVNKTTSLRALLEDAAQKAQEMQTLAKDTYNRLELRARAMMDLLLSRIPVPSRPFETRQALVSVLRTNGGFRDVVLMFDELTVPPSVREFPAKLFNWLMRGFVLSVETFNETWSAFESAYNETVKHPHETRGWFMFTTIPHWNSILDMYGYFHDTFTSFTMLGQLIPSDENQRKGFRDLVSHAFPSMEEARSFIATEVDALIRSEVDRLESFVDSSENALQAELSQLELDIQEFKSNPAGAPNPRVFISLSDGELRVETRVQRFAAHVGEWSSDRIKTAIRKCGPLLSQETTAALNDVVIRARSASFTLDRRVRSLPKLRPPAVEHIDKINPYGSFLSASQWPAADRRESTMAMHFSVEDVHRAIQHANECVKQWNEVFPDGIERVNFKSDSDVLRVMSALRRFSVSNHVLKRWEEMLTRYRELDDFRKLVEKIKSTQKLALDGVLRFEPQFKVHMIRRFDTTQAAAFTVEDVKMARLLFWILKQWNPNVFNARIQPLFDVCLKLFETRKELRNEIVNFINDLFTMKPLALSKEAVFIIDAIGMALSGGEDQTPVSTTAVLPDATNFADLPTAIVQITLLSSSYVARLRLLDAELNMGRHQIAERTPLRLNIVHSYAESVRSSVEAMEIVLEELPSQRTEIADMLLTRYEQRPFEYLETLKKLVELVVLLPSAEQNKYRVLLEPLEMRTKLAITKFDAVRETRRPKTTTSASGSLVSPFPGNASRRSKKRASAQPGVFFHSSNHHLSVPGELSKTTTPRVVSKRARSSPSFVSNTNTRSKQKRTKIAAGAAFDIQSACLDDPKPSEFGVLFGLAHPIHVMPWEMDLNAMREAPPNTEYFSFSSEAPANAKGVSEYRARLDTLSDFDKAKLWLQEEFRAKSSLRVPLGRNGRLRYRALFSANMWRDHAKLVLFYRRSQREDREKLIGFSMYGLFERTTDADQVVFTDPDLNHAIEQKQVACIDALCPGGVSKRQQHATVAFTLASMMNVVLGRTCKYVVCRLREKEDAAETHAGYYPLAPYLWRFGFKRVFRWLNVALPGHAPEYAIHNDNSWRYVKTDDLFGLLCEMYKLNV